jgi:S-adenosylmethionine hydrolase
VARFITFLTDFGLQDDFVGTCHGVMKRIAPEVEIIDITHGIAPQAVLQGALTLANTLPFMPEGVHLAVVDPGVGGARRALALRDGQGRIYVGPDNGLLIPAAEKLGGITEAHELASPEYALESVSRTFHGRDLFSPAAAHLALGVPLSDLGPPIDPDALARLDIPQPDVGTSRIHSIVLSIDRFGNIGLNLDRSHLDEAGVVPGTRVELLVGAERSSSTRTPTGTSRSRSTAATQRTCSASRKVRTFGFIWTRFEQARSRPEVRPSGDERRPTKPAALALLPAARAQAVRRDRRELGHDARPYAPRPVRSCAR